MLNRRRILTGSVWATSFALAGCSDQGSGTADIPTNIGSEGTLYQLFGVGQSHMAGLTPGSSAISTQPTSGVEMFVCGVHPFDGAPEKDAIGRRINSGCFEDSAPAVEEEQADQTPFEETPLTGAVGMLASDALAVEKAPVLLTNLAYGGVAIEEINSARPFFENLELSAGAAKSLATKRLMDHQTLGILCSQGWSNRGSTGSSYSRNLRELIDRSRQSVGSSEQNVPFLLAQMSETDGVTLPPAISVQLSFNSAEDSIYCVGPTYAIPHAADGLHFTSRGSRIFGAQFGKVLAQVRAGLDWAPLHARRADLLDDGGRIRVVFHVPRKPLVIDLSTLPERSDRGFSLVGEGEIPAIERVELASDRQDAIDIYLSGPLNGEPKLGIGASAPTGADSDAGPYWARLWTNIRDSDDRMDSLTEQTLFNWACHQTLDIRSA